MKYFIYLILFIGGCSLFFFTCNMWQNGVNTVQQEFKPSTLLKKYEYFKDLSAAVDKKRADIKMYQTKLQVTLYV